MEFRGKAARKVAVSFVIRKEEERLNRSGVNSLQINAANGRLFTAGRDSVVRCWDISSYGLEEEPYIQSMEHHTDWVNDIVLCGDGHTMMSASSDTTLKMWDTQRALCLSTLRTHKDYVKALAYAPDVNKVVSGGLDRQIYLWDITTLTNLTATNNTITTSSLLGHKQSIYSLAMNRSGSLVISGSTEKSLRVWDPRKLMKITKLKGHSDNIRSIVMNSDGTECLSASSDGTVRLWSIGQQRCIDTFRVHSSGVWTLAVDNDFTKFYSAGRDGCVFVTEITAQESTLLFCEDSSVLRLCLDPTDDYHSIWVATSNTHINKWPTELVPVETADNDDDNDNEDASPLHCKPVDTLPGGDCVTSFSVLSDKRHILTKDRSSKVALWDVFTASKVKDLGEVDMEEEERKWQEQQPHFIPNWFSVDVKTGMLMIRLEESDCFASWVLGDKTGLSNADADIKVNYGALMLRALFEHWPPASAPPADQPSDAPQDRKFFQVCPHTPIILSEAGDCGCTLVRFLCRDAVNAHESKQLSTHLPVWVEDIVCRKLLPTHSKLNFLLLPYSSDDKKTQQLPSDREKLSAQDLILVSKVADYITNKLDGVAAVELLCMDQVLDNAMDIRTIKHTIWKGGGDMKLFYREVAAPPPPPPEEEDTVAAPSDEK
ncbi:WD repeat-containing protein 48-like isoform X2 [Dysidea avara]|uniref:WD repeat-containing protein 48-like isoform X2 n=1 Tax=Dysidea avara TaxID=196820 RepID=UPI003331627F